MINPDVEKAYIEAAGDPSVGIPRSSFIVELFIPANEPEMIMDARLTLMDLYAMLCDEPVTVLFDFELAKMEQLPEGDL